METIRAERKDEISPCMRATPIGLYGDWLWLDDRIDAVSAWWRPAKPSKLVLPSAPMG